MYISIDIIRTPALAPGEELAVPRDHGYVSGPGGEPRDVIPQQRLHDARRGEVQRVAVAEAARGPLAQGEQDAAVGQQAVEALPHRDVHDVDAVEAGQVLARPGPGCPAHHLARALHGRGHGGGQRHAHQLRPRVQGRHRGGGPS